MATDNLQKHCLRKQSCNLNEGVPKILVFERLQAAESHAIQFIVQIGPTRGCQQTEANADDG